MCIKTMVWDAHFITMLNKNKDINHGKKIRVTIKGGGVMEVKRVHDNCLVNMV